MCWTPPKGLACRVPLRTNHYVVAIVALATVSLIVTQITFSSVATRSITQTDVDVTNPTLLSEKCAALARVYRSTDAQLLATNNLNVAYGCAAEDGLNTLDPDLRSPGLVDPDRPAPTRTANPRCRTESQHVDSATGQCTPEPTSVVLVRSPLVPAVYTLDRIKGMYVVYGPNLDLLVGTTGERSAQSEPNPSAPLNTT